MRPVSKTAQQEGRGGVREIQTERKNENGLLRIKNLSLGFWLVDGWVDAG